MQRNRGLVQFVVLLLSVSLVASSCFSSRKTPTNGGKNRRKLGCVIQQYNNLTNSIKLEYNSNS